MGCGGGKPPVVVRTTPAPRPSGPGFARVVPFADPTHPGEMQTGMKGDWVLENDQMRVVVSGTELRLGGKHAGTIVDASPLGGVDLLREVFPFLDPVAGRQAVYSKVGPGPGATLVAEGVDSQTGTLGVTTTYAVAPNALHLDISTSVANRGKEAVQGLQLGDGIQWGRATTFGPGVGRDLAGKQPLLPFLLGYGEGTAYAWVSTEADLSGTYGVYASAPVIRVVDLAPGDSVIYTRRLYVTPSAALASAAAWMSRGYSQLGTLRLDVEGKGERHVRGGTLEIRKHDGPPILAGELSGEPEDWVLPAGDVFVHVRHPERGAASSVKVSVEAGKVREVKLHLPQPASVSLRSIDGNGHPIPARFTFEGLGDTPTPDFGPRYDINGSGNYHFTPRGSTRTHVPPGRYRITATRGPAYQVWRTEVSLPAGKDTGLEARLVRLEIPPAWVSADLNVHAVPTEDAPVGLDDRAKELACEGIEWFVSGDAGHRTTYASVIDTLRLAAPLHAITGEEVLSPVGRFQAFPLPLRSDKPGNGALAGESMFLDAIFDRLHGEGEVLIQVLEPRAAPEGYFDRYAYTAKVDTARAGFRRDFDLIEILNGKSNPQFSVLWDDWMRLLGSDSPVTAVGNSDSRSLYGDEVGVPRNYVALEPSTELDPVEKFLEGVRLGRVVVSNGPFIDFTLGGVGVGGTLTARGTIQGHIRVVAPSWVDVKRVRVFLNGREDSSYMTRGQNRTVRFDEDIEITVNSPSFVVVRVEGDEPMDPVVTASGGFARPTPIAFTNPIWVKTEGGR